MKIKSIEFNNWTSIFKETGEIECSTDPISKVTAIFATNGAGKTNILNGIHWLFTGNLISDSGNTVINRQSLEEAPTNTEVAAKVTCVFEHKGQEYQASRTAETTKLDAVNDDYRRSPITIMEKQEDGTWTPYTAPQDLADRIFPSSISHFFMFEGESLKGRFSRNPQSKKLLQKQIRDFFGLSALTDGIQALSKARAEFSRELTNVGESELEEQSRIVVAAEDAIQTLETELQISLDELDFVKDQLADTTDAIEQNQELLENNKRRNEIDTENTALQQKIQDLKTQKYEFITRDSFKIFLPRINKAFITRIHDLESKGIQFPSDIKTILVTQLLDDNLCLCGRELCEGTEAHAKIKDWLEKSGNADVEVHVLSLRPYIKQMQEDMHSIVSNFKDREADINNSKRKMKSNETELEKIALSELGSSSQDIAHLAEQRDEYNRRIEVLSRDIGSKENEINNKKERLTSEISKRDSLTARSTVAKIAVKRQRVANESLECIQQIFEIEDSYIRQMLADKMKESYQKLSATSYIPEINDEYMLSVYDPSVGSEYETALSGGEKQMLGFCFIGSILEISKERNNCVYPLILDSPFGVFAEIYRSKVSEYLIDVADQLIMLVTDSNYTEAVKEKMDTKIGKKYSLVYNSTNVAHLNEHDKSMVVHGHSIELIKESNRDFEFTEIVSL